jgi:hypothetical protein
VLKAGNRRGGSRKKCLLSEFMADVLGTCWLTVVRVKDGIAFVFIDESASGSKSRLGAHLTAKKPALPLATRCYRCRRNQLNTLLGLHLERHEPALKAESYSLVP